MKVKLEPVVSGNTILAVAEGVISSDLNGEVVILNMNNGTYYGLDEVGHRVWTLVQQPISLNEIVETIIDEYEVESDLVEQDLLALVDGLIDQSLIEVRG